LCQHQQFAILFRPNIAFERTGMSAGGSYPILAKEGTQALHVSYGRWVSLTGLKHHMAAPIILQLSSRL
jgi:hypothetical protein